MQLNEGDNVMGHVGAAHGPIISNVYGLTRHILGKCRGGRAGQLREVYVGKRGFEKMFLE